MRRDKWILILAFIGILLAAYALPLHYASDGTGICNISESFNCDKVNKSPWSELFGIPVALLGLIAHLVLFLTVLKRKTIAKLLEFSIKDIWQYVLVLVGIMVAFQVYLTYVEIMYIHAYCIICLTNQVVVLLLAWLTYSLWKEA